MLREDVIRRIVERERTGQGLAEEAAQRETLDLYLAASTLFGTWETAL